MNEVLEWLKLGVAGGAMVALVIVCRMFIGFLQHISAQHRDVVCNHLDHQMEVLGRLASAIDRLSGKLDK